MSGVGPILEIRGLIVETLERALPGINVEEFPRSEFTSADLDKALSGRNVAVRVAFAGVLEEAAVNSDEEDAPCMWAIFICDEGRPGHPARRGRTCSSRSRRSCGSAP
jgi:hypothetical protein